jgi:hypothetical protein
MPMRLASFLISRQKTKADFETERGEIQISYTVLLAQAHKVRHPSQSTLSSDA